MEPTYSKDSLSPVISTNIYALGIQDGQSHEERKSATAKGLLHDLNAVHPAISEDTLRGLITRARQIQLPQKPDQKPICADILFWASVVRMVQDFSGALQCQPSTTLCTSCECEFFKPIKTSRYFLQFQNAAETKLFGTLPDEVLGTIQESENNIHFLFSKQLDTHEGNQLRDSLREFALYAETWVLLLYP